MWPFAIWPCYYLALLLFGLVAIWPVAIEGIFLTGGMNQKFYFIQNGCCVRFTL